MPFLNKQLFTPRAASDGAAFFIGGRAGEKEKLRYGAYFLVFLNIVALVIYTYLFVFILDKKDAIVASVSKLDTGQLKEQQLRALTESFRETEKERETLAAYFINSEEIVSLIEDIEKAGRRADVMLQFRFVNIRDFGEAGTLAMEFETIGSFNEIFYFLKLTERLPFRISLEKFLFDKEIPQKIEKRKKTDTWHAIFTISVLSFINS